MGKKEEGENQEGERGGKKLRKRGEKQEGEKEVGKSGGKIRREKTKREKEVGKKRWENQVGKLKSGGRK